MKIITIFGIICIIGIVALTVPNIDFEAVKERMEEKRLEREKAKQEKEDKLPLAVRTAIKRHKDNEIYSKFGNALCFKDYVHDYYGCKYKDEIYYIHDL